MVLGLSSTLFTCLVDRWAHESVWVFFLLNLKHMVCAQALWPLCKLWHIVVLQDQ